MRKLAAIAVLLFSTQAHAQLPPTEACLGVSADAPVCETGKRRGWYFDKRTMDMHLLVRGVDWLELDPGVTALTIRSAQVSALVFEDGLTFQSTVSVTGDLSLTGGASGLTFSGTASSILVDDNDTTALLIGSTGQLNLLTLDTGNDTETVIVTGTTATDAFHVDVGEALFDEAVDIGGALTGD